MIIMARYEQHYHLVEPPNTSLLEKVTHAFNEAAATDGTQEPHLFIAGDNIIAATDKVVVESGPVFNVFDSSKHIKTT